MFFSILDVCLGRYYFKFGISILTGFVLTGCVAGSHEDVLSRPATLVTMTKTSLLVEDLPSPRKRIPISVFQIKDETGQHKPADNYAEFSRAVTQAGGAVLIDILKKASNGKWFQVLERVELANIVQERKILQQRRIEYLKNKYMNQDYLPPAVSISDHDRAKAQQRLKVARDNFEKLNAELKKRGEQFKKDNAQNKNAKLSAEDTKLRNKVLAARDEVALAQKEFQKVNTNQSADYEEKRTLVRAKRELEMVQTKRALANLTETSLPSLKVAKYVIAGSIVGYDSNETTDGVGAKFLGIGGDAKHRRDIVTINLRLVSPFTGEILASVTTTKTIYAVGIQGGAYKFVSVDKLLEIEAGITRNELSTLAVRHGMELAVFALIAEGVKKGIWQTANEEDAQRILEIYEAEQYKRIEPRAS